MPSDKLIWNKLHFHSSLFNHLDEIRHYNIQLSITPLSTTRLHHTHNNITPCQQQQHSNTITISIIDAIHRQMELGMIEMDRCHDIRR